MKKLLLILLFGIISTTSVFSQDIIEEAYFHELKGMEDSVGVTHLFYREYIKRRYQCKGDNADKTPLVIDNNVYHFNTLNNANKVKFRDRFEEWCLDDIYDSQGVRDYDFYDNDPNKWIAHNYFEYTSKIVDYLGNTLDLQTPIVVKTNQRSVYDYGSLEDFYLSPGGDSLYLETVVTIPFAGRGNLWPVFESYEEFTAYADSVSLYLKILSIHPNIDSLYFSHDGRNFLYLSQHYTGAFNLADSSGSFYKLAFDADSSSIYAFITRKEETNYNRHLLRSNDFGIYGSWDQLSLPDTDSRFEFIETDSKQPGNVYVADSNNVFISTDFGTLFKLVFSSEDLITGLYKKPDSDLLYVLTLEELLEINTETKETSTLKKLPVSSEAEPSEIPNQITLKQNYPNPFNPTTVISYQLNSNQWVRLEVFDVTGRKVALLVDGERKTAGDHRVNFDGSGFSSGIYFYRLQTGGQTLTRKMLLMK